MKIEPINGCLSKIMTCQCKTCISLRRDYRVYMDLYERMNTYENKNYKGAIIIKNFIINTLKKERRNHKIVKYTWIDRTHDWLFKLMYK